MSLSGWKLGTSPLPLQLDSGAAESDSVWLSHPGVLNFRFQFRQVAFDAVYVEQEREAAVSLKADLGPLPYSAQSPAARLNVRAIMATANEVLGPGCMTVDAGGRLRLDASAHVPLPVTAVGLMTALTRKLLRLEPFLDCLQVFLRPPCAPAKPGESPVQPAWRRR